MLYLYRESARHPCLQEHGPHLPCFNAVPSPSDYQGSWGGNKAPLRLSIRPGASPKPPHNILDATWSIESFLRSNLHGDYMLIVH